MGSLCLWHNHCDSIWLLVAGLCAEGQAHSSVYQRWTPAAVLVESVVWKPSGPECTKGKDQKVRWRCWALQPFPFYRQRNWWGNRRPMTWLGVKLPSPPSQLWVRLAGLWAKLGIRDSRYVSSGAKISIEELWIATPITEIPLIYPYSIFTSCSHRPQERVVVLCCLSRTQRACCRLTCYLISQVIWAEIQTGVTQPFASYGIHRTTITVVLDTPCIHDRNESTGSIELLSRRNRILVMSLWTII